MGHKLNSVKKKIVVVKDHYPIDNDPRVISLIKMLKDRYQVTYLGWNKNPKGFSYNCEIYGNYSSLVFNKYCPRGLGSVFFLPLWWLSVLSWLLRLDWDAVHIVNFTSLFPSFFAAKIKNKLIVYDIIDPFEGQIGVPNFLRVLLFQIDKLLIKFVNTVVLVDEMEVNEFGGIPNPNVFIVYDTPEPLKPCAKVGNCPVFTLFYAGYLYRERNLNIDVLMEAIKHLSQVRVIFAGNGDLVEDIKSRSREMPDRILYIGQIRYNDVLKIGCDVDLHVQLREPCPPNQKYICGSKFFQALMCGKPLLVHKGTSAAVKVKKGECGIVVDAHSIEEVARAISELRDNKELRTKLGLNARQIYERDYGWELMKQRLLYLYENLGVS